MAWKIVTLFIIVVSVCYKLCQKKPLSPKTDQDVDNWTYSPQEFQSPVLYGSLLKIGRILLQTPILSNIIGNFIYNQNHYNDMRDFGSGLNIIPSYLPIRLASDKEVKQHKDFADKYNYKHALKSSESIEAILGKPHLSKSSDTYRYLSIEDIHNAYKSKQITPYQFAEQSLSGVEKLSKLNGFINLNRDDVLKQAKESTSRWKSGKMLSILDGVPIVIKDDIDVKGYNTSHGTSFLSELNGVADDDALIVSRLRQLGAIIFGKTNLHELGIDISGINSHWGTARNPYSKNLLHDTGGSSSGTAAVVAAGIVPIGVGTDGGGSIRVPSSFQGLVGIKATWNRIPLYFDGWWSVGHVGFLANNIRDAAICYLAVSGWKDNDIIKKVFTKDGKMKKYDIVNNKGVMNANPPIHLEQFQSINDLSDLKIGIYWDWFNDAQSDIVKACTTMINTLETKYKANVIEIKIPFLDMVAKAHTTIILSELVESESKYLEMNMPYHDSTLFSILFGKINMDCIDIMSAFKIRSWFMEYFQNEIFDKVDVIVLPMNAIVAPKYVMEALDSSITNLKQTMKVIRFAGLANFLGIPAFSVPVGYTNVDGNGDKIDDGSLFPIGLQIIANHWNEHVLFRVGNVIQREFDVKLPPNFFKHSD